MVRSKKIIRIAALVAVPLMVAALAACGPAKEESGPREPAPSSQSEGTSGQARATSPEFNEWWVGFASCMREGGFDVSDDPTSEPTIDLDDRFVAASTVCEQKVGPAPGQSLDDPATNEAMRAAAKCFRDKGYDVADPKQGEPAYLPDAPQDVIDECLAAANR